MTNIRPAKEYQKPDEDRVVKMFKQGMTFYSMLEDQQCTIEALFETLWRAHFHGKI